MHFLVYLIPKTKARGTETMQGVVWSNKYDQVMQNLIMIMSDSIKNLVSFKQPS